MMNGKDDMPAKRAKLDKKLEKLGLSRKKINEARSPKTKAVLNKLNKRK